MFQQMVLHFYKFHIEFLLHRNLLAMMYDLHVVTTKKKHGFYRTSIMF